MGADVSTSRQNTCKHIPSYCRVLAVVFEGGVATDRSDCLLILLGSKNQVEHEWMVLVGE
jgi:hypothetical protein